MNVFSILNVKGEKIKSYTLGKIFLFLTSVYFLPRGQNYKTYFGLILTMVILFFFTYKKNKISHTKMLVIAFLSFVLFTLIRIFTLNVSLEKDITEVARLFLPVYLLVMSSSFKGFTFNHLIRILTLVVLVDFSITLMEFFIAYTSDTSIFKLIKANYWAETHWVSRGRSKGLFSGPGQHASSSVFFFILFLSNYLFNERSKKIINLFMIFILAFIIFATLSRTGLICMLISFIILILIKFRRKGFKSIFFLMVLFSLGLFYFLKNNSDKLVRFVSLYESGISKQTVNDRSSIWNALKEKAFDNEMYLLIGWGKDYFGEEARQTDNEYVFMLFFYGLLFLVFFLITTLKFVLSFFYNFSKKTTVEIAMFTLIIVGYIFAIPSSFFFYIPNLILFSILTIINSNEKNKLIFTS
ncbi:O-antigen ligase family protein [Polaribacter batillariae]|uniref:O-antigen ligase family protein n=1 Tax=Polaribacter batillariae TaxID=2808900 RepID=A0ABX7SVG2_9FLAO|nr:O-antigen ligase family protein [Polaribacter batillariae]QTD37305.1 O-antigen ligase family protein [Polaribacter batillariae]